jgi:metal-sulfur cluster biosynthetic enzyme
MTATPTAATPKAANPKAATPKAATPKAATPKAATPKAADPAAVWEALGTVVDPEIDEPVTTLGFVRSCTVEGGVAQVRLRLPTFFCAPNFAWLMVADARKAVMAVPGVTVADVRLDDHFADDQISTGVAEEAGFAGTFADLAEGELDELRVTFWRKAYLAAVERVCAGMLAAGTTTADLAAAALGDVPRSADRDRLLRHRRSLGLPSGGADPLLVDEEGRPVPAAGAAMWLRRARTVRISLEGNGQICTGLLRSRYHLGELEERLQRSG